MNVHGIFIEMRRNATVYIVPDAEATLIPCFYGCLLLLLETPHEMESIRQVKRITLH